MSLLETAFFSTGQKSSMALTMSWGEMEVNFLRHGGSLYKVHETEFRLVRDPSMSTPPHDRAIPIPTNETQNGGVNNNELPRECGNSEGEGEEPELKDGSVPTAISQDDYRETDQKMGVQSQQVVRISHRESPSQVSGLLTQSVNVKNTSRMMDPSLQQLAKTTIEKLSKNRGLSSSRLFLFPTRKCPSQLICPSRGRMKISVKSLFHGKKP